MIVNSKSVAIIGISDLGVTVAALLLQGGYKVTIFEQKQDRIDKFLATFPHANIIKADVTTDNFVSANNLSIFSAIVVTIMTAVEASLTVANQIQKMLEAEKKDIYFMACAADEHHYDFLSKIGVKEIIKVNTMIGQYLALKLANQIKSNDFFLMNSNWSCCMVKVPDLKGESITLSELKLYGGASNDLTCIAVVVDGKVKSMGALIAEFAVSTGDKIVISGTVKQIRKLEKRLAGYLV